MKFLILKQHNPFRVSFFKSELLDVSASIPEKPEEFKVNKISNDISNRNTSFLCKIKRRIKSVKSSSETIAQSVMIKYDHRDITDAKYLRKMSVIFIEEVAS